MEKLSAPQTGEMMKLAGHAVRVLSEENVRLRQENSHFKKEARARSVAEAMEAKQLQTDLPLSEKIASIMEKDDKEIEVLARAVDMTASQMKLASVSDRPAPYGVSNSDGTRTAEQAADTFTQGLIEE